MPKNGVSRIGRPPTSRYPRVFLCKREILLKSHQSVDYKPAKLYRTAILSVHGLSSISNLAIESIEHHDKH